MNSLATEPRQDVDIGLRFTPNRSADKEAHHREIYLIRRGSPGEAPTRIYLEPKKNSVNNIPMGVAADDNYEILRGRVLLDIIGEEGLDMARAGQPLGNKLYQKIIDYIDNGMEEPK